ncbi:MAG: hypothetical protein ACKN9V_00560 [Pseudomonadota bacterium]
MPALFSAITAIFVFGLISCQSKHQRSPLSSSEENSLPYQEQPEQTPGSGPLGLKAQAIGLDEPHLYQIQLEWQVTNREPSTFFILKRNDWNSGRVVQGEQGYFKDQEVQEGKDYLYQVQMINGSKSLSSDWLRIQVPKDKVYEADEVIQSEKTTDYARLFLKNKVRISWQGKKVELRAQEIISEDAILESFSADDKDAAAGESGKSGGELSIHAKKLKGSLFVRADGQNGGVGIEGSKGSPGEKGASGPTTFLYFGSPEKYPPGAPVYRGYWFYCDPPRPAGIIGNTGGVGAQGLTGGSGGNSSKVLIEIEDNSAGDVFFTNKPGTGGEGGVGGPGGDGGEGGWSGEIDWTTHASAMPQGADLSQFYQCDSKQGPKGLEGPRGPQGPKGEDGYQSPFCLKLGKSQMGNCP